MAKKEWENWAHDDLRMELAALKARVETLEKARPGRKPLPIVISKEHVCGVDPVSDSTKCPHASLYRRQMGCLGDACVTKSDSYYAARRKAARGDE